jgi:hypothetical protein
MTIIMVYLAALILNLRSLTFFMKLFKALYSIFNNKCPRCHHGDVFKHKNPYDLGNLFNMHNTCSHCGLLYEKETGFFYGAMYASYGLSVGWFIVWYAIQNFFLNLDTFEFAVGLVISIVLMSPLSLRWSRLIWLNIFYGYDKELANAKPLNETK